MNDTHTEELLVEGRSQRIELTANYVPASHLPVYAVEVWSSYCDHQIESVWGRREKAEARLKKILAREVEPDSELELKVQNGEIREFKMEI